MLTVKLTNCLFETQIIEGENFIIKVVLVKIPGVRTVLAENQCSGEYQMVYNNFKHKFDDQ